MIVAMLVIVLLALGAASLRERTPDTRDPAYGLAPLVGPSRSGVDPRG